MGQNPIHIFCPISTQKDNTMIPTIETAEGRVKLTYPNLPDLKDFELKMDFNPIIEKFNITGKFCLLHWQAKPFGLRRWGIYDGGTDKYFAVKWDCLDIVSTAIPLQLDEQIIKTVPTAVLYFKESKVEKRNYLSICHANSRN
jgi:hypothetical protein